MAIDQGTATIAVTSQERTWRINIETPMGADPIVTAFRQVVKSAADGSVIAIDNASPAQRSLSSVATENQPFTPSVAGQVSGAELAALVASRADMWRAADIASPHKTVG